MSLSQVVSRADLTWAVGRWIPTTAVDQYGATLSSWFGLPDSALGSVFQNFANFNSQKPGFLG